ncbi:NAD/NADP-dependent betaine aldehyde dehydrogenase like protein [Verticillium longisporum]|uniref:aldehyde dehydrogenase (NAD(+)) n=3 Tax=Verticillium TaxID=1036719 RepID=G2XHU2_VERDV|nr:betaine aldehyde dehydrogenase [Verticillium dahliae VdLs.17]KAF3351694.1 DNA polymerase alpha subunit B [Verticillium dahliae VDG2]KAF3354881.1 Endoglucanase-4 [Verticillium dahliae VDG1]KAG7139224.1 NAD/NADP-dependent betaine aldehyde dehydrogenase like protein [Verticillium longisporum]KAH6708596.1 betaine aldehyde dehydrogenase [Verticillium dahliae]EGY19390.1 betaine aldehyde dehydrogenase [Verticillium dahliae VdLs.17]
MVTITKQADRHTIYNGRPQPASDSPASIPSIDPSTARPVCNVHTSSKASIDAAIRSAQAAFPSWAATPPLERSRILQRAVSLLRTRNDELARTETLDTGKPFSETQAVDVVTGADVLEFYANLAAAGGLAGEAFRLRPSALVYTAKEPLGVCAAIGAWNYPIQIALWKSAPALAAGNCLVYKPSEFTPLHAEPLAALFAEAGVPPGVFNVVYGAGEVGAALTAHPAIAKVSFTGQVSTGKKVAGAAAGSMKYATMELGGKSPLVVLPDADPAKAADVAMLANFFSSGQVCTNGTRVFVPKTMKPAFEASLKEKMPHVRAGDLFDPATNFGPLSSDPHREKVLSYIRAGINDDKATLLAGGPDPIPSNELPAGLKNGYWVRPTVFTDCTDDMLITREEIFGPVMTILYYSTVDEAVTRANTTELGLAAGVVGKDINLCHDVVARLEAGITWINTWGESPAEMSVGGWKQSGLGVENGKKGLEAWVRNKSTLVDMSGEVGTPFTKL